MYFFSTLGTLRVYLDHVTWSYVQHVTVSTTVESVFISVTNAFTLPRVKLSYTCP